VTRSHRSSDRLFLSQPSADNPGGPSSGSDIPQEYRLEVDRIFFEYLNKICSNCGSFLRIAIVFLIQSCSLVFIVDATDSKGEPIHQTLMAKKMQRLDESPDFRPFKFRIQAFTLAFLEEVSAFHNLRKQSLNGPRSPARQTGLSGRKNPHEKSASLRKMHTSMS
jgi:hypothetical protein